jgi:hypothetical protein
VDSHIIRIVVLPDTGPECCERIRALLRHAPGAVVECDVARLSGAATEVIGTLARLRLATLRSGGRLTLRHADPALLALLDVLGFADLLPPADCGAAKATTFSADEGLM